MCCECLCSATASYYCFHADPPTVDALRVNGSAVAGVAYALNGTRSYFTCMVSGTSPRTASWDLQTTGGRVYRAGTDFNSILTQANEGNYTCTVVNTQEGLNDSATVTVKVFGE